MFHHIQRLVETELSGDNAKEVTAGIHQYDRWSTFSMYRRSGNYIASRMREYGLEQVELVEIRADGETRYGDWAMPMAWDAEQATLAVAEPHESSRLLADYVREPCSLSMWSAPTPRGGVDAEVVLLPRDMKEADYDDLDLEGKIVFTSQHGGRVRGPAARHGALGVISDWPGCEDDLLAESVCWVNAWVDYHGWGFLKIDTPIFGFSLTREAGAYLRHLLEAGERVVAHADVRSSLYDGSFLLPTGVIPGETDEEVLVYGHAYEYGAEDNAAGCALGLEAARTLSQLIQSGALPRPKRSIRFMMSWECYGSIPWCVERIHNKRNVVAGLCIDDVGGKKALTDGTLRLILDPHCQASFADYAAAAIAEASLDGAGLPCVIDPWSGGTDHTVFEDPMFGVPMPWLAEHPARFHHTSLDEMPNIDAECLRIEGIFAATYLYFVANASEAEVLWLVRGTGAMWADKLAEATRTSEEALDSAPNSNTLAMSWRQAADRVHYLADRGCEAIRSAVRLSDAESASDAVAREVGHLGRERAHQLTALNGHVQGIAEERGWSIETPDREPLALGNDDRVPRRLVPGMLTLCTIPEDMRPEYDRVTHGQSPMWSATLTFGLYWADGQRTVTEIQRLVEFEFGPTEIVLGEYFGLLVQLGHIEWVQAP